MKNIANWLKNRPKWLQKAARMLIQKDTLTASDINELVGLCKEETDNQINSNKINLPLNALENNVDQTLRLCTISNIQGINALAPKKSLELGSGNLSIIYGQNGTGKSGYVRILKHACGARNPGLLLPNVWLETPQRQGCSISYEKDGVKQQFLWDATSGMIEDLRNVDIFDTSCGQVYVNNENEVTYEPPILSFFTDLIRLCETVGLQLDDEIDKLNSKKLALPSEFEFSELGQWYDELSHETTSDDLNKKCTWKEDDIKKLEEIDKRLKEKTPEDKVNQLSNQKEHIDFLINETIKCFNQNSDQNYKKILLFKSNATLKKNTAEITADKLFSNAPLEGIGSDVWQSLWEQARKYSEEQAYKDKLFPYVGEEAICVLCQQPLLKKAKNRLKGFEEFVKGNLKKEAELAKKKYDEAFDSVDEIITSESLKTKIDAAGISKIDIIQQINDAYQVLRTRKEELFKADKIEDITITLPKTEALWLKRQTNKQDFLDEVVIQEANSSWLEKISQQSSTYEKNIKIYDKDAKNKNKDKLEESSLSLKVRQWLSQQKQVIEEEIERLKKVHKLQMAKQLTNTSGLSRKKGDLAEVLITNAFVGRFNTELERLGATRIKIELGKTRTEKGKVLHQLKLQGVSGIMTKNILSEGEYKIISLAAFFADVEGKTDISPFVFDDPISSLDQDFEEAVVKRLVELSQKRQVIIFTHRLSLLGMIQDYGKKVNITPIINCIRYESWGTGEPGETPLFARKPASALNDLINKRLTYARKLYKEKGQVVSYPYIKAICCDFRILLERMIELELLADVVGRHRRAVNTMGKINKLAKINNNDCKFFDEMMTKYSKYQHSHSNEAPVRLPNPDELNEDLNALKEWHDNFKKRLNK
ncbi:MAG: hypothetical protein J7K81_04135 [Methanophagales archaeon]|nr:hypothetical protein [Methanophagales archaeon]